MLQIDWAQPDSSAACPQVAHAAAGGRGCSHRERVWARTPKTVQPRHDSETNTKVKAAAWGLQDPCWVT